MFNVAFFFPVHIRRGRVETPPQLGITDATDRGHALFFSEPPSPPDLARRARPGPLADGYLPYSGPPGSGKGPLVGSGRGEVKGRGTRGEKRATSHNNISRGNVFQGPGHFLRKTGPGDPRASGIGEEAPGGLRPRGSKGKVYQRGKTSNFT